MSNLQRIAIASAIVLSSSLFVVDGALARDRTPRLQGEGQPDELKVAQRRSKRKGKAGRSARSGEVSRSKRGGSKARKASARPPAPPQTQADDESEADRAPIVATRTGPARVDFDERLVQGQSNKSGAIYIFERKGAELRTMVRRRQSFREEILRTVD
ncbi:MAG: hypothetical protein ABIJ09_10340 [Pseudomonadota bacterium]